MKDVCQKWKVQLIFRGAWNSLMAWPDWPWPPVFYVSDTDQKMDKKILIIIHDLSTVSSGPYTLATALTISVMAIQVVIDLVT